MKPQPILLLAILGLAFLLILPSALRERDALGQQPAVTTNDNTADDARPLDAPLPSESLPAEPLLAEKKEVRGGTGGTGTRLPSELLDAIIAHTVSDGIIVRSVLLPNGNAFTAEFSVDEVLIGGDPETTKACREATEFDPDCYNLPPVTIP